TRTFLSAASLNIAVGIAAWAGSRETASDVAAGDPASRDAGAPPPPRQDGDPPPSPPPQGGAAPRFALLPPGAVATGACSLGLEILWTRALALVIGSSFYSFNLMLVAFLLGIVAGAGIYARLLPRIVRPALWLGVTLAGAGVLVLLDLALVGW